MRATTAEAFKLFMDGTLALADVERNGLRIDVAYLKKATEETAARIKEKEESLKADPIYRVWRRAYGDGARLQAPEQLGKVLKLAGHETKGGATRTGKRKVDKHALVDLAGTVPFVADYLRYKALCKVKSTYLGGIARELVGEFIHPVFNLNTVVTYRGSCDSPNGQNFPVRDDEQCELVRSCVIARPGHRFVEFDFKIAEVTVAACYHKDPNMLAYCRDPSKDMHRDMAAQVFKVSPGLVSKMSRYVAKNMVVFPFFYGSVWFQCAPAMWDGIERLHCTLKDTDVSVREHLAKKGITELGDCSVTRNAEGKSNVGEPARGTFAHHVKKVEEDFWGRRFPRYRQWKLDWYEQYRRTGGFDYLTGFRCEGLFKRNEAVNYPVQGSAFHCLLWCLIMINRWLKKNRMASKIVGQVHDSLLMDVCEKEWDDVLGYVRHVMGTALPKAWQWLIVPISVEVEAAPPGGNWFQKKPIEE